MAPGLVVCLRHGEKPIDAEGSGGLDDQGPGLDVHGRENRHSLTLRGWQRAGAFAGTQLCGRVHSGVIGVTEIFVPDYGSDTKDHRSYQTILPVSRRWRIDIQHPVRADDVEGLRARVLRADRAVVVCWEHDNLERFAATLLSRKPEWPHGRFDVFWLLRPAHTKNSWNLHQLDQALLPGDAGADRRVDDD